MKTEKVSINLTSTELGQIDYLVERGLYDNRSDLIRSSLRKTFDANKQYLQEFLQPDDVEISTSYKTHFTMGIATFNLESLQYNLNKGQRLHIRIFGILSIGKNVPAELIRQTVATCKVHGKIIAEPEVLKALNEIQERS